MVFYLFLQLAKSRISKSATFLWKHGVARAVPDPRRVGFEQMDAFHELDQRADHQPYADEQAERHVKQRPEQGRAR